MEFALRFLFVLALSHVTVAQNTKFVERYRWKSVDFDFPDEATRNEALSSGEFIPENNLPLAVEVWRNKLFVTLPRWKSGTAATLTYIDLSATTAEKSPKLKPYPNWEAHKIHENNGGNKITNVFRLNVDVCDRLWLVDAGISDILGKTEVLYGPKIQVYSLINDALILEYPVKKEFLKSDSFLANIVVDVAKDNCNKAYAYMPDLNGNALLVYGLAENDMWKIDHHYFAFDPVRGDYNIGGINFQWHDGIFGVALSPRGKDGYRTLYFHPMSSDNEFSVSTKVLQNRNPTAKDYHEYKLLGSKGALSQSSGSSLDEKSGVLFYTLLNQNAIGCWNTNKKFSTDVNGIVTKDDSTFIFPNDLKVDKNGTVWVLTDRLPVFVYSQLNFSDVNYRIFSAPVSEAIKGTVCDSSSSRSMAMSISMFLGILLILRWVK